MKFVNLNSVAYINLLEYFISPRLRMELLLAYNIPHLPTINDDLVSKSPSACRGIFL
jgi:hypothetical protein